MQEFLKTTIKEAGLLAKEYYRKGVSHKFKSDPSDLVTEADIAVNDFLIKKIREKFPDHGIISEEAEEIKGTSEFKWVMDPIDGTRNFAKNIAFWCTMIGIEKNGKPYMGAIYDAINDELFFAEVGKGSFLNGEKIEVGKHEEVDYSFVVFSNGQINDTEYGITEEIYGRYNNFYKNINGNNGHWLHNYGSCLSICHLACGRMDTVILNAGLYHDYLAGYVIATEAGAKFTDSYGVDWSKEKRDVLVANPKLHPKFLELFG